MCYLGLFVYYTTILRVHGRAAQGPGRDQEKYETLFGVAFGYAREFVGLERGRGGGTEA